MSVDKVSVNSLQRLQAKHAYMSRHVNFSLRLFQWCTALRTITLLVQRNREVERDIRALSRQLRPIRARNMQKVRIYIYIFFFSSGGIFFNKGMCVLFYS